MEGKEGKDNVKIMYLFLLGNQSYLSLEEEREEGRDKRESERWRKTGIRKSEQNLMKPKRGRSMKTVQTSNHRSTEQKMYKNSEEISGKKTCSSE